jgi:hypothetical protein
MRYPKKFPVYVSSGMLNIEWFEAREGLSEKGGAATD